MKEKITALLKEKKAMSPKEIAQALKITSSAQTRELAIALNELEDEKAIFNDHSQYVLVDGIRYMSGRARDVSMNEYAVFNKDQKVYVPKRDSRFLMDKDEVLVKLDRRGNEVVHVYERGITYIPGTFTPTRRGLKFRSDVDLHTSFIVQNQRDFDPKAGDKAVVKVTEYSSPLKVKIEKVLGNEKDPGVDIECILTENEVRQEFGKKVKKDVVNIPSKVHKKEIKDRKDLRDLQTVTIDGDSTKDFDDAISVEKLENGGWKLYVHIADVSYYVEEGSPIDEEAYKRGTSIYIADRVVPMLPFELSNGICSLNPDVDRLTLTCEMTFSPQGVMESYKVYDSVIHSDHRCTYSKVNAYLDNPESVKEYEGVGKMLQDFSDLAKQLKSRTKERGHIDFETREPYFILDEKGNPTDIVVRERGWSEQMIEEAMIAANVAVAHELDSHNYPGMYRVHEDPEKEKVESLISMARVLNVPCDLQAEDITPKDIARFLDSIEDEQAKEILSAVAVRAMQKARYSEENLGHYGLALDEYCHFTSPIRRYPDLLIHRMLRRHVIEKKNDDKTLRKDAKKMEKSALHLSEKERDAVTVERAVNDLEAAKYMESRVGQEFDGVITGVTNFGFFVELPNTVEGLVPLRAMDDDFYSYDQDVMMLTGENTGKTFKMGQKVRILVNEVNVPKRQITFTYLQDAVPEQVKEEEIVETKPEEVLELEAPAPVAEEEYPVIEAQFSEPEKAAENETVIPESLPEKEKETEGAA